MSYLYLFLAIVAEVSGTTAMKLSVGFTKLLPSILIFVFYGLSLVLLTLSLKVIDISVAYAIWSGFGTALISVIGILWLKESYSVIKIVSILLIILGVIGLNFSGGTHGEGQQPSEIQEKETKTFL